MKVLRPFNFVVLISILAGCTSTYKDDAKGLYIDYKGLKAESINVLVNQTPQKSKNFNYGDEITVVVDGIDDFKMISDSNVLPGAEYAVSDEEGNVVSFFPDLFTKYGEVGVSAEDAKKLKLNLVVGQPMEHGKTYYYLFRIWDKKSDKELKGNIEVNVL
ncbi:hypothetical protein [Jiulongibacter sediminis]|uniref:DUF4625 domain-containing protein n=1 Tax=Jiulongibacter sediminis TaxID=1605367 RepID=A0A0N8H9N2_9BACT|nr:hypothetical protein [Jiulongibacter sediminis]KPM47844.1 hypothetical protein AFM12_11390 [Jiulongibacter sediminis]TBX24028.1 hypothetical protein TK44_11395 [Jiulongibacter sediminis]